MNLKLRHLEVLVALIEAGSISRAARQLGLTQPAVSIALSNLEAELGFQLFHRSRGHFAPTRAAEILHAQAEQGLLAVARVERAARAIRSGTAGSITVASNGAVAINLLPRLIAGFQKESPETQIDLKVRSSRKIANWVAGGQADIGLIDAPVPVQGVHAEHFMLPCVCIMRETDPLAAERRIVPSMLANRSVIAITGDHAIDRDLESLLSDAGASCQRQVSSSFFAIARNLVAAGAGVALVDSINGRMDLGDGVIWRPFEPRIDFEFAVLSPPGRNENNVATRFRSMLLGALGDASTV